MNSDMLPKIFFFAWIFLSVFLLSDCTRKTAPPKTAVAEKKPLKTLSMEGMEVKILYYENMHRRSIGKMPVQLNSFESSVALQHCRNMAMGRTPFGHNGLELRSNTIERQIGSVLETGENIAYGRMTAKEVVESWLHSSMHRRNIEGNFILTGIGWAKDSNGMIYYTQIFTR